MKEIPQVEALLEAMCAELRDFLASQARQDPLVVGIRTGGVWVAEGVRSRLGVADPMGELNINFYRDDFTRIGLHPQVQPSMLPFDVDGRHVLLVDDVLHTGRTIRAAMNEIFDYGRPASITLAVLVERSGRELPIRADVAGTRLSLRPQDHIKLTGPEPLALEFKQAR